MKVGVLGPIELLEVDGATLTVGSPKQRLVLAVLASRRGTVVSTDLLIDAVWGDDPPESALQSLRTYISRLRRVVGGGIASQPGGYSLELTSDAEEFETLARASGVQDLRAALELWRGQAYQGLDDVDALDGERRRLEEIRLDTHERLAETLLASHQAAAAVAEAEVLLAEAPLREHAWIVLVDALIATGRPADALRSVNRAVSELAEAGLEPSPGLRAAEANALKGTPVASRRVLNPPPRRAPVRPASIIGRDEDIDAVSSLVDRARLITLIGPGGVGKTSLAMTVAGLREPAHRLGIRFVELAAVQNPLAVPSAVIDGLGLTRGDANMDEVLAGAGTLDTLLVLDNCEHLLDSIAPVVERMLSGGDALRILASSRERIGVAGEHVWRVGPLLLEGEDPPARQLFLERARAVAPDAPISSLDLALVDDIVRRVDGLPLAIEMAASGLATMGLVELAQLLEQRLDLLRSGRRSGADRHRTLRAVIEWSETLLTDSERTAWGAMSVFASPATRADIAAVVDETTALELAPRLAERSLLQVDRSGEATRYAMLETVKPQAAEQLGDAAAALHERHARHFAQRVAQLDADLQTPAEGEAVSQFESLSADIRQSVRWALGNDLPLAADIVARLYRWAHHSLLDQPLDWAERLLPRLSGDESGYAGVATAAADRAVHAGDLTRAWQLTEQALGADPDNVDALELAADIASYEGRLDESIELAKRLLAHSLATANRLGEAVARTNLSVAYAYAGKPVEAQNYLAEIPGTGPSLQGWLLFAKGEVLLELEPGAAIGDLETVIELADSVRNRFLGGVARVSLASLRAWSGDPADAIAAFTSIVEHWRAQGSRTHALTTLRHLVILLGRIEEWEAAAELYGAVAPDESRPSWGSEAQRLEDVVAGFEQALGPPLTAELIATGAQRSIDDAADVALLTLRRLAVP